MPAGHKSQEAPEGGQIANIRDGADVPFQLRLDVRAEPQPAARGTRHHLRVAAVKEADTARLDQTERQQRQDGGAPRHRLADTLHEGSLLGPGEQPLTHFAGLPIDSGADVGEQVRHILDLVEYDWKAEFLQQGPGIGPRAGLYVGVLQKYVGGAWEEPAQQGRLSGPSRPGQHHGGETAAGFQHFRLDGAGDETHMSILNHKFRFLKYRPSRKKENERKPEAIEVLEMCGDQMG